VSAVSNFHQVCGLVSFRIEEQGGVSTCYVLERRWGWLYWRQLKGLEVFFFDDFVSFFGRVWSLEEWWSGG
jgi:hypothetical protein